MSDLIRRSDAIDALCFYDEKSLTGETAQEVIDGLPAVDAVEVKHARWIPSAVHEMKDKQGGLVGEAYCSECKLYSTQLTSYGYVGYDYCPRCGARMDGRREDGDA